MAKHHRQLNGSTVDLQASSASVTPSVILRKEEIVQVTASDKPNLNMDVAKLESMCCLFGNSQGQTKGDMQQQKVRSRNRKRDSKICKLSDWGCLGIPASQSCLAIDHRNLNQSNDPSLWL